MKNFVRLCILLSPLAFLSFSSAQNSPDIDNYYNLQNLKEARPPYEIKLIKPENSRNGKYLIEMGVLITYKNRYAKEVKISGDFCSWKPIAMTRSRHGIWYFFLINTDAESMQRYKLIADGIWLSDPLNSEKIDDGTGSFLSVLHPVNAYENNLTTYRFISPYRIEFRLYKPNARQISLVGDFNNWNPENDMLQKTGKGIWSVEKKLTAGTYRYRYIVDGDWVTDLFNERTARDDSGDICSVISVGK